MDTCHEQEENKTKRLVACKLRRGRAIKVFSQKVCPPPRKTRRAFDIVVNYSFFQKKTKVSREFSLMLV
jgi:hypothetical protein